MSKTILTSQTKDILIGKTIESIRYNDGYCCIVFVFTDDTTLEVSAEQCFEFIVELT